jgi:hypothetical protein
VIVLDGEAVLLGVDGRSDFNGLHTRRHDHEVEFYAFDILVSDGEDIRKLLEPEPLNRTCGRHAKIGVNETQCGHAARDRIRRLPKSLG